MSLLQATERNLRAFNAGFIKRNISMRSSYLLFRIDKKFEAKKKSEKSNKYEIDLITMKKKPLSEKIDIPITSGKFIDDVKGKEPKVIQKTENKGVKVHVLKDPNGDDVMLFEKKDLKEMEKIKEHESKLEANKHEFENSDNHCFSIIKETMKKNQEKQAEEEKVAQKEKENKKQASEQANAVTQDTKTARKYTDKLAYKAMFEDNLGHPLQTKVNELESVVKLLQKKMDVKEKEQLSESVNNSKSLSNDTIKSVNKIFSDDSNVEILQDLLEDIKTTKKLEKESKFRQIRAYEWSKNKILHPDTIFFLGKNSETTSGYFNSLIGKATTKSQTELFPKHTNGFVKFLKRGFTLIGLGFVGLLIADIYYPELLQTEQSVRKTYTIDGTKPQDK